MQSLKEEHKLRPTVARGAAHSSVEAACVEAVQERRLARVRVFLRDGVAVNWQDAKGFSLLFHAIFRRHFTIAEELLTQGANIDLADIRDAVEPHRVEVSLDGKTYLGEWRTTAPTPEQKAATTYPHQKHIGQVRSTLMSNDGGVLDCYWDTHGETAVGSCSFGDRSYPLILK